MSLAFALMAAINGSTGSWATLSHGLNYRTKPRRLRPGGTKDSHPSWVAAQAPPGTLLRNHSILTVQVMVERSDQAP